VYLCLHDTIAVEQEGGRDGSTSPVLRHICCPFLVPDTTNASSNEHHVMDSNFSSLPNPPPPLITLHSGFDYPFVQDKAFNQLDIRELAIHYFEAVFPFFNPVSLHHLG